MIILYTEDSCNALGQNNHGWILQGDNDTKHKTRLCTQWTQKKDIVIYASYTEIEAEVQ